MTKRRPLDKRQIATSTICLRWDKEEYAWKLKHRFSGPPRKSRSCDRCGELDVAAELVVESTGG